MTVIARRQGESLEDAARRVATDALYASRDKGGTMHDAGTAAGDAVSTIYAGAVEAFEDFIAKVAAPTGRLRLAKQDDGDVLYDAVKSARATLAELRGQ